MNPTEAQEISTSPDEVQDLQDDLVIHQQTEPEPVSEITKDIESNKPKRPRTEKQKAAFEKARKALAEKRAAKAASKRKPGRPAKQPQVEQVEELPPAKPKTRRQPKVRYVELSSSSSSESEEEVVYVQRKSKAQKKQKQPKVVYISDSDSDYEEEHTTPQLSSLYNFV